MAKKTNPAETPRDNLERQGHVICVNQMQDSEFHFVYSFLTLILMSNSLVYKVLSISRLKLVILIELNARLIANVSTLLPKI